MNASTTGSSPGETNGERGSVDRRTVLAATAGLVGVAGCSGGGGADTTTSESPGIDDPHLWLHPDSEVATADGTVETWRDDSGNGYDFSQETPSRRPTLVENAVEDHAALRFDGEDDRFVREDALDVPDDSARTVVVVSRLTDLKARSPFLIQGTFGSSGGESNYYGPEANTYNTVGERFGLYLVSVGNDTDRSTDTDYHVHVMRTETFPDLTTIEESTTYYLDGQNVGFQSTADNTRNPSFEADSTAIGSFPTDSPETLLHGEIAEVRLYDRALGDGERSSLEDQLRSKYGI